MHRLILVLLALAACSPRQDTTPPTGFRPADAPIYSSAVLEPSRLAGRWVQVATFAPDSDAPCSGGEAVFDGATVTADLCLAQGLTRLAGPMTAGKPGRFSVPGMADWWVLWVDGDYRTLVVGTPGGEFGFVLNRDAALPSDRLKAVRDILHFNGYATGNLVLFN